MSQVQQSFTVCDQCGGLIPAGADHIAGCNVAYVVNGNASQFSNKDFCCTAHMATWVAARPLIATPVPPYNPPPAP